jgi:pimeloyl-ACP methyl ester carboxylesterase
MRLTFLIIRASTPDQESPMSPAPRSSRRCFVGSALAGAVLAALPAASTARVLPGAGASVRPFRINVSQALIDDMRRRLRATRWSDKETVADGSQGLKRSELQEIVGYWANGHDWRKAERRLNSYPQFLTSIDGLDIHFIHVRSRSKGALPLIITHGWPGSIIEQIKMIEPLTNPIAHGGSAEDSFDVVIPSLPGFGFSQQPVAPGWNAERIARAWDVLMRRLGYHRYVAQGGDWGAAIAGTMGRQAPPGLLGIHINLPAAQPPEIAAAIASGSAPPPGLSAKEKAAFEALRKFFQKNRAYAAIMATKPQVIGAALSDSPAGLAAFTLDYNDREPLRLVNRDELLDNLTLYWVTNSAASAARLYWEEGGRSVINPVAQKSREITVPVAVSVFPDEIFQAPETWTRQAYPTLVYFNEVAKGGHFAAWEEPDILARELRAAFRPLRG